MENLTKELKHILNDNKLNEGTNTSLYDFIAQNYYNMSKEDLKELVLNLNYAMHHLLDKKEYLEITNYAIEETIDRL